MNKLFILTLVAVAAILAQAKQPNILFFYADSWGKMASSFGDLLISVAYTLC